MSNLLKERYSLAKLRKKLKGRRGKLCQCYKGFRHLAQNCRKGEKEVAIPQNKFKVLSSRVIQCGVEKRIVRNVRTVAVEYFKCEEKGHKCRECLLWRKKEKKVKRVMCPIQEKVHQQEKRKLAYLEKGKAQECSEKREVRRIEEKKVVCSARGEAQQEK